MYLKLVWRCFPATNRAFDIVPPRPIRQRYYRCDKRFHTEHLKPLFDTHTVYGVLHVQGEEASLYKVDYQTAERVSHITAYIKGRHRRGGQSQNRFQRQRIIQIEEFVNAIVDEIANVFYFIPCIVVIDTCDKLIEVNRRWPTSDSSVVYRPECKTVHDLIRTNFTPPDVRLMKNIDDAKNHLSKDDGWIEYGKDQVLSALEEGRLEWVLASAEFIDTIRVSAGEKQTLVFVSDAFSSTWGPSVSFDFVNKLINKYYF